MRQIVAECKQDVSFVAFRAILKENTKTNATNHSQKPEQYQMARTPSLERSEAESMLGERGNLLVTTDNRPLVRKWLVSCGVPASVVGGLAMAVLAAAYNDLSNDLIHELIKSDAQPETPRAPIVTPQANNTQAMATAIAVGVQIKESSQPVDIARIAFSLGHSAFFRRLCFAAYTENTFTKALGPSLGHVRTVKATPDMNARGVYLIPSCEHDAAKFASDDAAATAGLKFILDSLTSQGCPAFPTQERDAA